MKELIRFLKSRIFWINALVIIIVIIMSIGLVYKWLDSFTDHGNSVSVPDLKGMNIKKVDDFLKTKNLSFKIADSSVYLLDQKPGTIVEQDPQPNEKVKQGRTIYLTITRSSAPMVKVPALKDVSLRQAEAILAASGLRMGEQIFKPDLAKNAVLSMMINGKDLKAGTDVPKGSAIDLIVGDGLGNTVVTVPSLIGLTYDEALFVLKGSSLNIGSLFFDGVIKDTLNAKIYDQNPAPDNNTINQGEAIDLYLRP
ncbi:MAG TPA: PASTA domain-containing protein [Bacteroidia bacterium]|nr:PASTA domain-containing protein [Bacteroidia bacterium]QQR94321.1 MAG: PASTA domain-containing protein [Bacteroidota bacterium]MBP7714617.1 PASTA domain-containing protein [Bacteroidia bacterium]MBP8668630.1 PASTA domain-containing protein [Bacteroidia bacterium]HOZ81800.1 PASTA domain-containing protein [Bacteroidia bacterium]